MANLSDAFGKVIVSKVGEEFIEFIEAVQADDNYYLLVDHGDYNNVEIDDNGDLEFKFSTSGRWNYANNLEGYLEGKWLLEGDKKSYYDRFINELKEKDGQVVIEYQDSDVGMDWMGEGVATLSVVDGEVQLVDDFSSEEVTVERFAEVNGENEFWALEYIHGDEVASAYGKYEDECKKKGVNPANPDLWLETIYKEENA